MSDSHKPTIIKGSLHVDDRGISKFINVMDLSKVKRMYQVENYNQGFIRAWRGHRKESKYAYVAKGAVLFATTKMDVSRAGLRDIQKFTISAEEPSILIIPAGYYNGFKTLTQDSIIIFFSTSTLEESKNDDFRLPYDAFGDIWLEDYR